MRAISYVSALCENTKMSYSPSQIDKGKILCLNVPETAAFIANRYYIEKLYCIRATLSKLLAHVYIDYMIIKITYLIDNIFVQFGGYLFRQMIGIPVGTNCAKLLAGLFLCSYENEFLDNMIRSGHRRLARSFNLCYRYIDDLTAFGNKKFLDYLKEKYPSQLTVKKANKSDHLADYLDLTFVIDSGSKLSTRLYG